MNKRLMMPVMITIFSKRISHPCVIINVLADVRIDEVVKILVGVSIINVRTDVVIGILSGVAVGVIIDAATSDIDVEVLTDVNTDILVAAMTALRFAMSAP